MKFIICRLLLIIYFKIADIFSKETYQMSNVYNLTFKLSQNGIINLSFNRSTIEVYHPEKDFDGYITRNFEKEFCGKLFFK